MYLYPGPHGSHLVWYLGSIRRQLDGQLSGTLGLGFVLLSRTLLFHVCRVRTDGIACTERQ